MWELGKIFIVFPKVSAQSEFLLPFTFACCAMKKNRNESSCAQLSAHAIDYARIEQRDTRPATHAKQKDHHDTPLPAAAADGPPNQHRLYAPPNIQQSNTDGDGEQQQKAVSIVVDIF